jgi:hypothetical protein
MGRSVRIAGLVRTASLVHRQLAGPLSPTGKDRLRLTVTTTLKSVDEILARHRGRPSLLPPPSRRAYDFLRALQWDQLPTATAHGATAAFEVATTFTYPGLTQRLNALLDALFAVNADAEIASVQQAIALSSRKLEFQIARRRLSPERLSRATRQFRGWLAYLAKDDHVARYVRAAHLLAPLLRALPSRFHRPISVHFRPMNNCLFKLAPDPRRGGSLLQLPTPMIGFDSQDFGVLLEQLAEGTKKRELYELMAAEPYQAVQDEIFELEGIPDESRGAFHDLAESFDRVNDAFFGGQMGRPHLMWSKVLTGRKFGHYVFLRDTVLVSRTLDQPSVPQLLVDYVVYHELLHKLHGLDWSSGCAHAHTPAFNADERKFPQRAEAEAWLTKLATD